MGIAARSNFAMHRILPALLLVTFLASCPTLRGAPQRPNVLLICVDDLKPLLGCYGNSTVKSPNIDRLATRGMVFENAFCNQAVCSPSRNALLTGLRPQTLGIYDLATNFRKAVPDAVTLPQHFKAHGYRAEGLGKIFHVGHGNVNDEASWSVPHFTPRAISYALEENNPPESARKQALVGNRPKEPWKLPRGAPTESADVPDNRYGDGMIADEAIKRLEAAARKPTEPFFLAVGFLKPHLPFVAPRKYWDLYDPASFKLPDRHTAPEGAPEFAPTTWGELRQYKGMPGRGPLTEAQARHLIHGYHAATSYMDAQVGRVLDALDANGLASNTIIMFWGDHGWHLGDHGMWCKHTNYEQAARIPLILIAPGIAGGQRTKALVETVDLYPTLAALADLPAPERGDGLGFATVLTNPSKDVRDHVIHVYPRGGLIGRAIRTERYRLIEWKKPGEAPETAVLELYDYDVDPAETNNLAASQPEVVGRLREMLARHPEAKSQIPNRSEPNGTAPKRRGGQDRGAMFDQRDRDKNGQLSREEFLANQPDPDHAPKRFPLFDADGNGVLSREEFVKGGRK